MADLVTEGLTNPQIGDHLYVSRRTVQTHLTCITKLDIGSRSQHAAEVTRRRVSPIGEGAFRPSVADGHAEQEVPSRTGGFRR